MCSKDTKVSLAFSPAGHLTGILRNRSQCSLQRTGILHPERKPGNYREHVTSMQMCVSPRDSMNPTVHPAQRASLPCSLSLECPLSGPILFPNSCPTTSPPLPLFLFAHVQQFMTELNNTSHNTNAMRDLWLSPHLSFWSNHRNS